ncbi:hypothetical protein [Streptomyces galbus]|uniref:Uncharacterized protein n=1 Tax=Streptomyces galbus TaxID=33898 RepID=A0A4U5W3T2_STRGB|nr:hypothetical protein [Streptomyces galbus]TKS96027.1 hypothetical protein E4U92_34710 [Streptomyces galbus]GHD52149.1 hypothetical protein GCM10010335_64210 [Streptomyces galbus]
MSEAAPHPETTTGDEAAFDAWLAAANSALHDTVEAAIDLDAGRAQIFATSVSAETVPLVEEDTEQWTHLEAVLREAADSIAHWVALTGPHTLYQQLTKALSTTRTMTVVGRALLPNDLSGPWGLAADFLTQSHLALTQLRGGLAHRTIERHEALALHAHAYGSVATFQAALQHTLATTPPRSKAHMVMSRLLATTEMLLLLLQWNRNSIEHFFNDSGSTANVPSATHR